jgi:hypothetical protein
VEASRKVCGIHLAEPDRPMTRWARAGDGGPGGARVAEGPAKCDFVPWQFNAAHGGLGAKDSAREALPALDKTMGAPR